ncbi:MAG: DUF3299 domain-containing protein [Hyphomicrobiales bacterium]
MPESAPASSPLDTLSDTFRKDIEFIAWVRTMRSSGMMSEDAQALEDAEKTADSLRAAGHNVELLVNSVAALRARQADRQKEVVASLDGKTVSIPGYAVPLELDGSKVSEFLLVPYVGACIHVPSPPPNQIVYVRAKDGIEMDGLFASVKVTGRMSVKGASKSLFLVDGTSNVDAGYQIEGTHVEAVKK